MRRAAATDHWSTLGADAFSLLDRDRELAVIANAVESVASADGLVLVIEGAPGIGKTVLLDALRDRAETARMRVLAARGGELEREFSFGVARQLFERLIRQRGTGFLSGASELCAAALGFPDHRTQGEAQEGAFSTMHGLFWLAADLATEQPLVLLIDDAHWADEPSLAWLTYLGRRIGGLRLLVAIATRPPGQGEHDQALASIVAEPVTRTLRPGPLNVDGVAAAVENAFTSDPDPTFAIAVHDATGGNPLLVHELLRTLVAEGVEPVAATVEQVGAVGPDAVARWTMLRVGGHGRDAVALARALSVLDRAPDRDTLASFAGIDRATADRAIAALSRAHVLGDARNPAFAHPVVRQAVYLEQPLAARASAHARAALLLHERGALSEEIAGHLLLAPPGAADWATPTLRDAAARALRLGTASPAVRYLGKALEERTSSTIRGEILHELGRAEALIGEPEAIEHLQASLVTATGDSRVGVALDLARALMWGFQPDSAADLLERTLSEVAPNDRKARLRVLAELIPFAIMTGRPPPALPDQPLSGATPEERLLLSAASAAQLRSAQPLDRAVEMTRLAWADGLLLTDGANATAVMSVITVMSFAERFGEAATIIDAAIEHARRRGSVADYVGCLAMRSLNAFRQGDIRQSVAASHEALDIQESHVETAWTPLTLTFLIDGLLETGELDVAAAALADHGLDGPLPDNYVFRLLRERRARLWIARGEIERGLEELVLAGRALEANVATPFGAWRSQAAVELAKLGRRDEARDLAEEELTLATRVELGRMIGVALRGRALADDPPDEGRLLAAADSCAGAGAVLEQARALSDLGASMRRRGARVEARVPLRQALELTVRCGATLEAERAKIELRAAGGRSRRTALSGADALTPSEARVAGLAAGGRSNREIAQALYVTIKTVEKHLANTYMKLDITSKRELPDALGTVPAPASAS